jgi:hypothetical protein
MNPIKHQIPFVHADGGQACSRRPKERKTCTVVAVALAKKMPFDEVHSMLEANGREYGKGFKLEKYLTQQSWAKPISFPAEKGKPRMNVMDFVNNYCQGAFIVKVAKHVFYVRDGVVYDTSEPAPHKCVYKAWRIE